MICWASTKVWFHSFPSSSVHLVPSTGLEVYGLVGNTNMRLKHLQKTAEKECFILFGGWEIWGTKKLSWKILHHDPVYTCIYMYVQCVYTCINWYVFTGLWYKVGVYMKQNNVSIRVLSALQYLIVYSNVFHKTI